MIYFVMPDRFDNGDPSNDRGGLTGDRSVTGFDPTDKAFYHGGDLKGLTRKLGYIQGLGATAVWLTPIFKNKAVQGPAGHQSAAYHGYWITDFTRVDQHLGSNADFKDLVEAAHARGMKVYLDIVTNHTADVITFKECVGKNDCPYRSIADYPYTSDVAGLMESRSTWAFPGRVMRERSKFRQAQGPELRLYGDRPTGGEGHQAPRLAE